MTLQDKDFYLKIILRLFLYADVTNAKVARSGDSTQIYYVLLLLCNIAQARAITQDKLNNYGHKVDCTEASYIELNNE